MELPEWWPHDKPYAIMDCLEGMKGLPDKCVDLVLTDPPYGIGEDRRNREGNARYGFGGKAKGFNPAKKGKDYGSTGWDDKPITKEFFDQMFRISKNQIIFGGNYYIQHLEPGPSWIIWDKDNGDNDFADCEMAWTSFNRAVRKIKYRWNGLLQEDMKNKEKREHQTQKPMPLFEWILEKYSDPEQIVLDPFLGSGTTLGACRKTNRIGLGFEINPEYEPIIRKRSLQDIKPLEVYF